jgi:phosphoribosyl 1,2-cyclic phosphodiesterase
VDIDWSLRFIGTGSSGSQDLGPSSAVVEHGRKPLLLIDCGHGTPARFRSAYGRWPGAVFLTHVHLDHVGGLEQLHAPAALGEEEPVRLYVPATILQSLHERVGSLEHPLAEGRSNFWDAFRLVPVGRGFWHAGHWFDVFESRHHAPGFAYGIRLAGRFLYTGDTRPIPEVLRRYGRAGERLFHDCGWGGNPSHTGLDDIKREYEPDLLERLVLYHYESHVVGDRLAAAGMTVARPGERFDLGGSKQPRPAALDAGPTVQICRRPAASREPSPGPAPAGLAARGFE